MLHFPYGALVNPTPIQWYWWNQELEDEEKQKNRYSALLGNNTSSSSRNLLHWCYQWRRIWWVNTPVLALFKFSTYSEAASVPDPGNGKVPSLSQHLDTVAFWLSTRVRDVEKCFPGAWMMLVMPADVWGTDRAVSALSPEWLEHPRVL